MLYQSDTNYSTMHGTDKTGITTFPVMISIGHIIISYKQLIMKRNR